MRFSAIDEKGDELLSRIYYSVGGGFVVNENRTDDPVITESEIDLPYPFESGEDLLRLCKENSLSISELMLQNEFAWRDEANIRSSYSTSGTLCRSASGRAVKKPASCQD